MTSRARRRSHKLLTFWISTEMLSGLEQGIRKADTDRSKFIRNAIREKLAREGIRARNR